MKNIILNPLYTSIKFFVYLSITMIIGSNTLLLPVVICLFWNNTLSTELFIFCLTLNLLALFLLKTLDDKSRGNDKKMKNESKINSKSEADVEARNVLQKIKEFIEKLEATENSEKLKLDLTNEKINPQQVLGLLEELGYQHIEHEISGFEMNFWIFMVKDNRKPLNLSGCGITSELALSQHFYDFEEKNVYESLEYQDREEDFEC